MKQKFFTLLTFLVMASAVTAKDSAENALMRYAGNIHQFNSIYPQEKVYLQFDNTSYYSGETIWFKAFVVNASTLGRAQSKVLYVDLISPEGILLKQQKLKIVAGQADGSFQLVDGSTAQARDLRGMLGYPSGFYEIRAYTNYMQNFGSEFIFSRVFAVYDKPKEEGNYYDESPTITVRYSEIKSHRPETPKQRNINATFYPEGGHLIIGKPCRVAFKVTDETGIGTEAEGTLVDNGITFSTMHDGMGFFEFTPTQRSNKVELTAGGNSRSFLLPDAEVEGCAMRSEMTADDGVKVTVRPSDTFNGKKLGLTITCRGELMDFAAVDMTGETTHEFKLTEMPEGVFRITLFDTEGAILATRSFYHQKANAVIPSLTVQSNKSTYSPFERIMLSFDLTDGKGTPFRDRFCLAVRDSRSQTSIYHDDLRTSMLLSSDLKGFIENPFWYFEPENANRLECLDLLCMVQGWERYDWSTMAGINEFSETHRKENGLTLNGWVFDGLGRNPISDVEVNAAIMPQDKTLSETYRYKTDKSGYFGFDIGIDFYEKARLTISVSSGRKKVLGPSSRLMFERSITPQIRAYEPGEKVFIGSSANKSRRKDNDVKPVDDGLPMVINVETGYILPDVIIDEQRKYVDYFTFQAYDVLKDVEIEMDKGEYTTDVRGYLIEKGYQVLQDNSDTSVIINGYPAFFYLHTANKYRYNGIFEEPMSLDTRNVKSIIIYDEPIHLREAWSLAPLFTASPQFSLQDTLRGITSAENERVFMVDILVKEDYDLSTREDLFNLDKRIATVDGFSRPYSFYSPEYPDGPIPGDVDYRRTLYWNPNVITDENGHVNVEFYNSSITSHFNVEAAGITAGGVPYTLDAGF